MKKITAAVVAVCLAGLVLTGCSKSETPKPVASTSSATPTATEDATPLPVDEKTARATLATVMENSLAKAQKLGWTETFEKVPNPEQYVREILAYDPSFGDKMVFYAYNKALGAPLTPHKVPVSLSEWRTYRTGVFAVVAYVQKSNEFKIQEFKPTSEGGFIKIRFIKKEVNSQLMGLNITYGADKTITNVSAQLTVLVGKVETPIDYNITYGLTPEVKALLPKATLLTK